MSFPHQLGVPSNYGIIKHVHCSVSCLSCGDQFASYLASPTNAMRRSRDEAATIHSTLAAWRRRRLIAAYPSVHPSIHPRLFRRLVASQYQDPEGITRPVGVLVPVVQRD